MKRFLILLVIALVMTGALFAGGGKDKSGADMIGLSVSTLNNPFFVTLVEGAQSKADALGYKLVVLDAQDNPSKQLNDIEDLIGKKVKVLLINPTDSDAVVTAIQSANKASIPVITVDRGANGGEIASHVASDNVAGGMMAGEYLLSLVGANAKVAELEGIPGASATRDRGQGFNAAVEGRLDVVAKQTANFNRAEGLTVMENILQANPEIVGVFAHNDEMALGAVKALQAAGRSDVAVVGFDATDDAVAAVQNGEMKATVAQKPALIGALSVEAAAMIIKGEMADRQVDVELQLVK